MSKAATLVNHSSSASVTEICQTERGAGELPYDQPLRWVTALFVQFRFLYSHDGRDHEQLFSQYCALLEEEVGERHGDVVALSRDQGLAIFAGVGQAQEPTENAVEAAASLIRAACATNARRIAHNLSPLRLGIGLDGGALEASGFNRHPRLDPGLQPYLNKARRLSELNYQAPFPTIFVSHAVANRLNQQRQYLIQNLGAVAGENLIDPLTVYAVIGR